MAIDKQIAIDSINDMPQKIELEELFERLIVIEKIERGREDVRNGNTISHEEAKEKLRKWLK